MNRRGHSWLSGVIALAATLLILFGAQALYHTIAVAKPLDKAFEGIDGVRSVTWDKKNNDKEVTLRLDLDNASNLQTTYKTVETKARTVLGKTPFQLDIRDTRTPELEQTYHALHFHIQEAVVTGRFSEMADKINEKAKESGVKAQVYVDAQNVYLQLTQGDADLYAVIPRNNTVPGVK